MNNPDSTILFLLLDENGEVCGLQNSIDETFEANLIFRCKKILSKTNLYDGYCFSFEQEADLWQVEMKAIKNKADQTINYLAVLKCLSKSKTQEASGKENETIDLKNKVKFYEKIINGSCDEIFITDGRGKIMLANPISEKNYGIQISDMIGKSVWELEERGIYYPAVTPMVLREKKKITIDQETAIGKKMIITATPIFDKNGEIEMVICNSRDITALEDMKKSYQDMKNKVHQKIGSLPNKDSKESEDNQIIYSDTSPLVELMRMAEKIARTESIVLLQGETGTGKDLFAILIHNLSNRKDKQFLKINCAALPKELIESELFGYKSGAFTGASPKGKIGQFSLADHGTILLDEIGEIPLALQPKLLQVIEEQKFVPIGSHSVEKVDVRIIASTNRDLKKMIEEGLFREDLYYRICVLSINILPLRNRRKDIPLLIDHFLKIFNAKHKRRLELSHDALTYLINYNWPGNVRELRHLVEHLSVTASSITVIPEQLPPHITSLKGIICSPSDNQSLHETMETIERDLIVNSYQTLKSSYKVARNLGISQSSATRKIRKYIGK